MLVFVLLLCSCAGEEQLGVSQGAGEEAAVRVGEGVALSTEVVDDL